MSVVIATEPLRLRVDVIPKRKWYRLGIDSGDPDSFVIVAIFKTANGVDFVIRPGSIRQSPLVEFGARIIHKNQTAKICEGSLEVPGMPSYQVELGMAEAVELAHGCGHLVVTFWIKIQRMCLAALYDFSRRMETQLQNEGRTLGFENCSSCPLPTTPSNGEFAMLNALPNLYNGAPFTRNDFTNFCIKVGSEEFWVQKAIVAAQSKYFLGMLTTEMVEKRTGVTTVREENVSAEQMKSFLEILYGRSTINEHFADSDWLTSVYEVAHAYEAKGVTLLLEDAFGITNITTVTFLQLLGAAQLYSLDFLVDRCATAANSLGPGFWDDKEVKESANAHTDALIALIRRLVK